MLSSEWFTYPVKYLKTFLTFEYLCDTNKSSTSISFMPVRFFHEWNLPFSCILIYIFIHIILY